MTDLWLLPDQLVIVGDEAWTRADWAVRERKRAYDHAYNRRPEVRAHRAAYNRDWMAAHPGYQRAYREARRFLPCPGPRCLTNVRGGGLCGFCRRTLELES
jgi:hypothetical protein